MLGFARNSGSYAEFAVVPVSSLAKKSKALSFEEAAGVPIAGETAYRSLHEAAKLGIAEMQWPKQYLTARSQYETNLTRAAAQPVVK